MSILTCFVLGTFLLLSVSGILSLLNGIHSDTVLVHCASGYHIRVLTLVKAAVFLGILASMGIMCSLRARLSKIANHHFDVSSDLPFLGMRAPGRRFRAWQF